MLRSSLQVNFIGNVFVTLFEVQSPLQKWIKKLFLDYLEVLWNHKSEWFFITCSLDVLCIWSRDWCFKLGPPLINPSWLLRNKLKLVFIVGILRLSIWRDFFSFWRKPQSPTSLVLTDRKRTAQILRAKTLRVFRLS